MNECLSKTIIHVGFALTGNQLVCTIMLVLALVVGILITKIAEDKKGSEHSGTLLIIGVVLIGISGNLLLTVLTRPF